MLRVRPKLLGNKILSNAQLEIDITKRSHSMRKSERLSPIKTAQTSYRPRKLSTRENEDKSSFASQPEGNMEKPPKPINRITLTKQ